MSFSWNAAQAQQGNVGAYPADALWLDPIQVQADKDGSPTGPVQGYVARRSATATKTNTPILETPQSISVVGRKEIEDQGGQTVAESLRYTAGVVAGSRPGNRFDDVFIRGFGGFGYTAGYIQFLDGLKMQRGVSYAISTMDPFLLERIEVIKGPASVLYGQTNPGGLVNMVSKRPTDYKTGEVELQIGNYGRTQLAVDSSGPLDKEGKFLYRFTGVGLNSDTSVDYTEQQRISIAPAFTWRPTIDTTLIVLTRYQKEPKSYQPNYLPAQGLLPGQPGVPSNPYGRLPTSFYVGDPSYDKYDREQYSAGYQFEHRFNDMWTVRQNLRYQHVSSTFYAISARQYTSTVNPTTIQRARIASDEKFDGVVVDNQAQAKFKTGMVDHTALFGIDYQYVFADRLLTPSGPASVIGTPTLNTQNPVYYQNIAVPGYDTALDQTSSQLGFYAQDQMKIGNLTIALAGRHDDSRIKFDTTTLSTGANTIVHQDDGKFTYRAGALYLFESIGVAPFVNVATSFEPAPYLAAGNTPLAPMTGRQYEGGVKYQPSGYNLLVTASLFDIVQQNVVNPDPANSGFYTQTGEVRSRGFEFEAKASLSENIDITAAYTALKAEVTADKLAVNVGKRPVAVPATAASFWADYTFHSGALNGFGLGAGVRYIGETAGDPANTFFVPSFTLVDALVHYDLKGLDPTLKGWSARLNVTNLFDKEYVAACFTLANGCFWGARRTVVGSLKYAW